MPKIKTLLKELSGIEGVDSAVLEKIQAEGDRLEAAAIETKNGAVAGNKKVQALEKSFGVLATQLGIEGELDEVIGDVTKKALALVGDAEILTTERDTLKTQLAEVEKKVTGFEQAAKVQEFATAGGLEPKVFKRLLGDRIADMQVKDGALLLGETPIKDAIAADEELSVFSAALFKSEGTPKEGKGSTLPKGSPKGSSNKEPVKITAKVWNPLTKAS